MARVRNLSPGFFTNELIVELPFEYRLLFAGLWTLADREGRLEDRPKRIRMAIFPCDDVDCDAGIQALHDAGLVLRYAVEGVAYIAIPAFCKHQKPHPRETTSAIPAPQGEPKANLGTTQGEPKANQGFVEPGGLSDSRTLGLSERGKERESAQPPEDCSPRGSPQSARGSRIPDDFPDAVALAWCREERPDLAPGAVTAKFRDYWLGVPGQRGRKADWPATWRNFVRSERGPPSRASPQAPSADDRRAAVVARLTGGLMGSPPPDPRIIDVESAVESRAPRLAGSSS